MQRSLVGSEMCIRDRLEEGQSISKIAKEVNITRQTIYRIKNDNDLI
ncbi:hypothetical protein JMUB7513_27770 [Staphylococcus aureus]